MLHILLYTFPLIICLYMSSLGGDFFVNPLNLHNLPFSGSTLPPISTIAKALCLPFQE